MGDLAAFAERCAANMVELADVVSLVARERPETLIAALDQIHDHEKIGRGIIDALEAELTEAVWAGFLQEHSELTLPSFEGA